MSAHTLFTSLSRSLAEHPGIGSRSMMGNPAVTFGGKILFMLARSGRIVFRIGPHPDVPPALLERVEPFAPTRTRAPMRGWFEYTGVSEADAKALAAAALKEVS